MLMKLQAEETEKAHEAVSGGDPSLTQPKVLGSWHNIIIMAKLSKKSMDPKEGGRVKPVIT